MICADFASFRSDYLSIVRSTDGEGNPLMDAEYYGYDDGGTPEDESDDNYIYLVRYYDLRDWEGVDASQGEIWLFDPDLDKVGTWSIAGLECLDHGSNDGLEASEEGIRHALLVPVPVSVMADDGTYVFLAHIKDDHAGDYRDHRKRWALDLNNTGEQRSIVYIEDGKWHTVWSRAPRQSKITKTVRKFPQPGESYGARNWVTGVGSGKTRGAVNGGFFNPSSPHQVIGEVGVGGKGWEYEGMRRKRQHRWCFGMKSEGHSFGRTRMTLGEDGYYWAPQKFKENYPYGLTTIGLLVDRGVQRSPDKYWPDWSRARGRTAVGWTESGHLFFVTVGDGTGAKWYDTAFYFLEGLPQCIAGNRKYSKWLAPGETIEITTAMMLDGGGSTQLGYRRKNKDNEVVEEATGAPNSDGRKIRNIVAAEGPS